MTKNKPPLRGAELNDIYPRARTYEQREAGYAKLEKIRLANRPKRPRLKIALLASVLLIMLVLLADNLPVLWGGGSIALIFFSFGAWIVIGLGAFKWASYASEIFYAYGASAKPFWIMALLWSCGVFAVWSKVSLGLTGGAWLAVGGMVYFVGLMVGLRVLLQTDT